MGTQVAAVGPQGTGRPAEFRGVVENEVCPVYLGRFTGTPAPEPVGD